MKLKLNPTTPFDLESTLQCGQLFRWAKQGDSWHGVVKDKVLRVQKEDNVLRFEGADNVFIRDYFRLDDDLPTIVAEISRDSFVTAAIKTLHGLRLVRQDPWECLVSYICATYKNIPAIKKMMFELSKRFGQEIADESCLIYAFPKPYNLAKASIAELRNCGLGYRAKRVREAAQIVVDGEVDFEQLRKADYKEAKERLMQVPGVGHKVADCVVLFSLDKLEAFPVDIWVKRIIERHYSRHFDRSFIHKISTADSLSKKAYDRIGLFARSYFGRYAGYAQEYLFHFARGHAIRDRV